MKNKLIIILFLLCFMIAGCESSNPTPTPTPVNPTEDPTEPDDPVEPGIKITGPTEVLVETEIQLEVVRTGISNAEKATWLSEDYNIASVYRGLVTAKEPGTATIICRVGDYEAKYVIEVTRPTATALNIEDTINMELGGTYELPYSIEPHFALEDVVITDEHSFLDIVDSHTIKPKKAGSGVITVTSVSNPELSKEITVKVFGKQSPQFKKSESYVEVLELEYGVTELPLDDLEITDNADGDMKSVVQYDKTLLGKYGPHDVELTATDRAGNVTTFTRKIEIIWPYHTKFIGHAGCYKGNDNSEEAFLNAATYYHYQAIECDLRMTKDGVFVVNHDDDFGGKSIANTTYEDLLKVVRISSNKKYVSHICTFERYLEICKEYGCEAIVELKWVTGINGDQSLFPTLINFIKERGMWEQTTFLTSTQACIKWLRNNGYDVPCQYLVMMLDSGLTEDVLNFCTTYHCDLSVNVVYNTYPVTDEMLAKFWAAGCKVSTFTFSGGNAQVQTWIDKGVEYVTCDCHFIDDFKLYREFEHTLTE